MSVLTPVVSSWDGANRRAYLAEGVSDFYPIEDIYHEYRNQRRLDHGLRKYEPLLKAAGNIPKGGGAFTPRYVVLLEGFKLIPFNETLQLNQLGDMITDDPDTDATLYDVSGLTVAKPIFIKPSNAETVQLNSESIVFSSFQGAVWVDTINGYEDKGSSTEPNGNTERPVKYISLAVDIAYERGFNKIQVIGDLTLTTGDIVEGLELIGTSHVNSDLIVESGAECLKTMFRDFNITGVLDGESEINNCTVGDLEYFDGHIHDSRLDGTIVLSGNQNALIDDCSMLNILNPPVVDCGYSNQNLILNNWSGQLTIKNTGVNNNIGVGCDAADIILDPSCNEGIIAVSGTGSVTNLTTGGCYVVNKIIDGSEMQNLKIMIEQLRPHHTGGGKMIFWDPHSGSDIHHGDSPERGFKTWTKCHDAANNAGHDTIVIVPSNSTGVTTITEDITVTKDYLFVRGPGRDVVTTGNVTTTASGTEFHGFRVQPTITDGIGIHSTGAFTLIDNVWFEDCHNGLLMEAHHPLMHNLKFHAPTGYGIRCEGDISHGEITNCTIGKAGSNGIEIATTDTTGGIKMSDTVVLGCTGYGVNLEEGTTRFVSQTGNVVEYNELGNFNNLGVRNVLNVEKSWATKSDVFNASQI